MREVRWIRFSENNYTGVCDNRVNIARPRRNAASTPLVEELEKASTLSRLNCFPEFRSEEDAGAGAAACGAGAGEPAHPLPHLARAAALTHIPHADGGRG